MRKCLLPVALIPLLLKEREKKRDGKWGKEREKERMFLRYSNISSSKEFRSRQPSDRRSVNGRFYKSILPKVYLFNKHLHDIYDTQI